MAFATKYSLTWADVENVEWEVYFQVDPWAGAVTELTPGATPLVLTWNQSEKYQVIVGSSADIQMVYETAIDDLFTDKSQFVKVLVRRNSENMWHGFITPGQYHRQFNQPKHYVTLTATDGLGELKNIKFEDGSGDPYFYQAEEITALYNCLAKTGLPSGISEGIGIYEDNQDSTVADSPLDQTYIYPDMYWDEQTDERGNCDVVVEDILRKYGATVRQDNGGWLLLRPNSFSVDDIQFRIFVAGSLITNTSITSYKSIDSDNFYIHADQEITRLLGVGRSEITQDPPRRSNMFKSGAFESFMWDGSDFDYWTSVHSSGTTLNIDNDNGTLKLGANGNAATPTEYIEQSVYIYYPNSISISFDWTPVYTGTPSYKSVYLQIYDGAYYYTTSGWQSGVGYYTLLAPALSTGFTLKANIDIPAQYAYGYDRGFTLRFRIYEFHNENAAATNYVKIDNLRLDVGMDLPETKLHAYDNSITINNVREETVAIGDSWVTDFLPSVTDEDAYYVNTYDTSFSLTQDWSIYGDVTASAPLCELLARQYVEGYRKSLDVFRGSIRSADLDFAHLAFEDSNIVDDYGFAKRFFPNGISYNARTNEWNGEWVECPATYNTSTSCDAFYSENFGTAGTITGNLLEIVSYDITSVHELGVFETYAAAAGETVRFVVELTDDSGGYSDMPIITIDDGGTPHTQTVAWGLNYLSYHVETAGNVTIILGGTVGDFFYLSCEVDFYTLTGR